MFGTLDTPSGRALAGENAPAALGEAIREAWIAFARDGDPGWPAYAPDRRAVMIFDEESGVGEDPEPERRMAWEGRR